MKVRNLLISLGGAMVSGVVGYTLYPVIRGQLGFGSQMYEEHLADVPDEEMDENEE